MFPSDPTVAVTVPSLGFLIKHPGLSGQSCPKYSLFDLGLRDHLNMYMNEQQTLHQSQKAYVLGPGVALLLRQGGLDPNDIDTVILSRLHYDHHGDSEDFPDSECIVGAGSLELLRNELNIKSSHQFFDKDLFKGRSRVSELPSAEDPPWKPLGPFGGAFDLLGDGSIYVVDAPGHLPCHINLLCCTNPTEWKYLGGDSLRLSSGQCEFATWTDDHGDMHCIHA